MNLEIRFCAKLSLIAALTLSLQAKVMAQSGTIYNHVQPIDSSLFQGDPAEFSFWVPDSLQKVKGIYFFIDGVWGSSLGITSDTLYRQLASQNNVILMGCKMHPKMSQEAHIWSADAVIHSLDTLSNLLSEPFVKDLPVFLEGYSLGGQFAYHFTRLHPQRVIGFVTMKGGKHLQDSADAVTRSVPALWFKGELDWSYRLENMDSIFDRERPKGALWALITEKGTFHDRLVDKSLIYNFFNLLMDLRFDSFTNQFQPLNESCGYLMQDSLFQIAPYNCAPFNKDSASWLPPDSSIAKEAQNFASEGTVNLHTKCQICSINIPDGTEMISDLQVFPNPAKNIVWVKSMNSEITELGLYDLQGSLILNVPGNHIDLSSAAPGHYVLKIESSSGADYRRLVKP